MLWLAAKFIGLEQFTKRKTWIFKWWTREPPDKKKKNYHKIDPTNIDYLRIFYCTKKLKITEITINDRVFLKKFKFEDSNLNFFRWKLKLTSQNC